MPSSSTCGVIDSLFYERLLIDRRQVQGQGAGQQLVLPDVEDPQVRQRRQAGPDDGRRPGAVEGVDGHHGGRRRHRHVQGERPRLP